MRKTIPQQLKRSEGSSERRGSTRGNFDCAARLFEEMSISEKFPDFLTVPAYELLD